MSNNCRPTDSEDGFTTEAFATNEVLFTNESTATEVDVTISEGNMIPVVLDNTVVCSAEVPVPIPIAPAPCVVEENVEEKDPEAENLPRPIQLVDLDQENNKVILQEDALSVLGKNLKDSGADAVSIVAIMGTYRTGKSFLLDLMMRYIRHQERISHETTKAAEEAGATPEGNEDEVPEDLDNSHTQESKEDKEWKLGDEDTGRLAYRNQDLPWVREGGESLADMGFKWQAGPVRCTQGIWFWSHPYILEKEGRKIAVMFMDTQGAWDGKMSRNQCATIFGLTALLSSKLIYNMQNRIDDSVLDNLEFFTAFAQQACSNMPGAEDGGNVLGHLHFLVRDWSWYEEGFNYEQCCEMMLDHMQNHLECDDMPQHRRETANRLRETFRGIGCSGLTYPGRAVVSKKYTGSLEQVSPDFLNLVDRFMKTFLGGDFPVSSAPLGNEIVPDRFEETVRMFVGAFKDNKVDAIGLRDAFVKLELIKRRDNLMDEFRYEMNKVAPPGYCVEPDILVQFASENMPQLVEEFDKQLRKLNPPKDEQEYELATFKDFIYGVFKARQEENLNDINCAMYKIVASPVIILSGYYVIDHTWLLITTTAIFSALMLRARAEKDGASPMEAEVCIHCFGDVQSFAWNRVKDCQAMYIAFKRCSPGQARDVMQLAITTGAAVKGAGVTNNVTNTVTYPMATNRG